MVKMLCLQVIWSLSLLLNSVAVTQKATIDNFQMNGMVFVPKNMIWLWTHVCHPLNHTISKV